MKRFVIFLISLLVLVAIVNAVSNSRPIITARYDEKVVIIGQNLTNIDKTPTKDIKLLFKNQEGNFVEFTNPIADTDYSLTGFYPDEDPPKAYYDYQFKPIENLAEGNYWFNITSADDLNNQKNTSYSFEIKYAPLDINIENPSYGASTEELFDVIIRTNQNADCRWALIGVSYDVMRPFDESDGTTFTRTDFRMTSSTLNFYVKCKDSLYGREHSKRFELIVDKTKPNINIEVTPKAIYEPPQPFKFNVTLTTDDDTVCRHSDTIEDYDTMSIFSDVMNKTHRKEFSANAEGKHEFNLKCKNSADILSDLRHFSFQANLSMPTKLSLVSPVGWVTEVPSSGFALEVETTRRAECKYEQLPNGPNGTFRDSLPTYTHSRIINPSDGIHTFNIKCETTQGPIEKPFEIKVDTKHPDRPTVNDDGDLENNKGHTYKTDRLRATFTAKDDASGIAHFNYSIVNKSNNHVIDEGITDAGNCNENKTCTKTIVVDGLDLQDKSQYFFRVMAIDAAGLTSFVRHSDGITVDKSKKPVEKTKPKGWITKKKVDDGIEVTLHCVDQGTETSGCAPGLYEYDIASSKTECSYKTYTEPVIIEETAWFCWFVSDNAENIAEGAEQITITKPERKDRDDDGILDTQDNCPDMYNEYQEDTDSDDIGDECDNCPRRYNPSQYDSDYDGIGDSCDTCPDTSPGASVNTYGCSMTQEPGAEGVSDSDRDNDGMPDNWEEDNGLDPDDPSDAELDNDSDGLTNKEEYDLKFQFGDSTNPNNEDTDDDKFTDMEEINTGTDPLDPNSKPKKGSVWSVLLLIFGILVLLGGLGYLGYTYYLKGKIELPFMHPPMQRTPSQTPHGLRPMQQHPSMPRPMLRRRQLTPQQHQLLMRRLLKKKTAKQEERRKAFGVFGKKQEAKPMFPATKPVKEVKQTPKAEKGIKPVPKPQLKPKTAVEKLRELKTGKKTKEDIFGKLSSIGKKKK